MLGTNAGKHYNKPGDTGKYILVILEKCGLDTKKYTVTTAI